MQNDSFAHLKTRALTKEDKSKKGSWDKRTIPLCNTINKSKDFFTTSSCSGRVVLIESKGEKKNQKEWLYTTHDKASAAKIRKTLEEYTGKNQIEFKQQSAILHVACRTIEQAQDLQEIAMKNGFKRSGIISTRKKIIVEMICTEQITVPIFDNTLLVTSEYLTYLTKRANEKIVKNWQAIAKLKKAFEEYSVEEQSKEKKKKAKKTNTIATLSKTKSNKQKATANQ